ncbi:conserved exported hypothetical protein [Paraburkholderia piptadeniae]|uniref:Uncharacterized protein n=1 Tax=Paraburkholderia piptadeniae TaxID=1701573 RepID=A0A1N7S0L3_9BURK|nr:hypothetical protein [Paraburkholderia piptadeniae]SIT40905.1 conserved exported hypothetical protein [Paraburkholderia piptadeniae]
MKFTRRTRACALSGLLALLCADSTVVAKHDRVRWPPQLQEAAGRVPVTPLSAGVLIQPVNFFLDQDAQTKEEEAQKKHKAEQQHRAATARPKPNPKAASAAAASMARPTASQSQASSSPAATTRTEHGVQSAASEPSPSQGGASATPAAKLAPASSAVSSSPTVATTPAPTSSHSGNQSTAPARLTREQLIPLMRGATILRTNTSGALRQWVNGADGTLTVYWAGGGFLQSHSASGKWSVTEDGHFCLQIDWPEMPENWCRFLERTANGAYQPIPDSADASWTPPKDKTEWRPMTVRR